MTEFEILSVIGKSGSVEYVAFLNRKHLFRKSNPVQTHKRLQQLLHNGLISGKLESYSALRLTPSGIDRLDALIKERSDRRRQFFHDWMIAVVSILGGALLSDPLWSLLHRLFD